MMRNKIMLSVTILGWIVSCAAFAQDEPDLDKELQAILKETDKSLHRIQDAQAKTCSHVEDIKEDLADENDNALVLKHPLKLDRFGTAVELAPGDKLFVSSSISSSRSDQVKFKFETAGGKKGSAFLSAVQLLDLLKKNDIMSDSCS